MATLVALLRAVNVGGTGKLPMAELRALCEHAGLTDVRTYIQSGNVVFRSGLAAAAVKAELERRLADTLGKPVGVHIRRGADLERVLANNPFPDAPAKRVLVVFYDKRLTSAVLTDVDTSGGEKLVLHGRDGRAGRELYIHFPDGQGQSKLKIPEAKLGTARNLNTVAKLAAMAATATG